jgi:hypothetical protein
MLPNGFSVPPAVLVQPQRRLPVLLTGLNGPAWPRQGEEPLRTPLHPMGPQHGRGACELRLGTAHDEPDFAAPRHADTERARPRRFVLDGHGPVCGGGDTRHPVFHSQVGPRSPDGLAYHVLEDDAGALEMPMVLQEAEPILVPIAGPGHALVGPLQQHMENLRRNAQRIAPQYGPLAGLPGNNSASNFAGAALPPSAHEDTKRHVGLKRRLP